MRRLDVFALCTGFGIGARGRFGGQLKCLDDPVADHFHLPVIAGVAVEGDPHGAFGQR